MSRHLVDPKLEPGLRAHLSAELNRETLSTYRSMLFDMVAAIPKSMTEAMARLGFEDRRVPGLDGEPEVRVLVYAPPDADAPCPPSFMSMAAASSGAAPI